MANVDGFRTDPFYQAQGTPRITGDLDQHQVDYWPTYASIVEPDHLYNETLLSLGSVTSAHRAVTGFLVPSYKQDYYYRVHITPPDLNIGSVLSDQTQQIEIWNAWEDSKLLAGITSTGANSVTLTGPDAPPTTFAPNEYRLYTLTISSNGPPVLDATFTLAFPSESPQLALKGTRVTLFTIPPNWKTPVRERLEWFTDVLQARDTSEQRFKVRQNPRQAIEYAALLLPETVPLFGSYMAGWHSRQWGLPVWFHAQRLKSAVVVGATQVPCTTAGYEFYVDGYAVIYLGPGRAESFQVKAMTATGLESAVPLGDNWPAGAEIMPLRFCYLKEITQADYTTGEVAEASLLFSGEQHRAIPPTAWPTTYRGLPVLEVEPNWEGTRQERWDGFVDTFETNAGQSLLTDRAGYARFARSHRLTALGRAKVTAYRNVLYYAQGRYQEFWGPSGNRDCLLAEDVQAAQNWLTAKAFGYTALVKQHPSRRDIRVSLRTGQHYYRRIVSSDATNTAPGTEKLFLDAPFPVAFPARQALVSFMPLSRLESDTVETDWITPDITDTALTLTGVLPP